MIEQIILAVHVLIAVAIVGLILLQQGKGADMGASFGGGSSQTLFGASGSGNVLSRSTAILATLFFVSSFGLAIVAKQKTMEIRADSELTGLETVAEQLEQAVEPLETPADELPIDLIDEVSSESSDIVDEIPQ